MDSSIDFRNEPVNYSDLPQFETIDLFPIQNSFKKIIHFNYLILELLVIIGFVVWFFVSEEKNVYINLFFLGVLALLILIHIYNVLLVKTRKFCFREHDVIYKSGIISLTTTIIPYNKLQHLAVYQGWMSRYLNLASLEFFTAGGDSSDLKISGMKKDEAFSYREFVLKLISENKPQNQIEQESEL